MSGNASEPARSLKRTKQNEAEDPKASKIARLTHSDERLVNSSISVEIQKDQVPNWTTSPENTPGRGLNEVDSSLLPCPRILVTATPFNSFRTLNENETCGNSLETSNINTGSSSVAKDVELSSEVCLGMILGGKAAYVDGALLDESSFNNALIGDTQYMRLKLILKKNYHVLCFDYSDVGIAVLDNRTSTILQKIEAICPTQFCVFKYEDESLALNMNQQQGELNFDSHRLLHLVIHIYSPRNFVKAIGKELSTAGFYLQRPYQLKESILYENPHEFKSRRQANLDVTEKQQHLLQESLPCIRAPIADRPREEREASLVDQLLKTQIQNQTIKEINPHSSITTNLLPHQKRALYFIRQRERGTIDSGLSLWKSEGTKHQPYYRHTVHGWKTPRLPEDNRGGLLADEMGLGKTLSLISAIVTSLDDARAFSRICVEENRGNAARRSHATLVIAPSIVLLDGWLAEIRSHVQEGMLSTYLYHGQGRHSNVERLLDYDIILTTYAIISAEHSKASPPLQRLEWFRIVLDEAHFIRNPSTKLFQAVCKLKSERRWCLSGTPVQNSLEDLASLMQFLRVPFLDRKVDFKRLIISPLLTGKPESTLNIRRLLDAVCLRRMIGLLELPKARYQTQPITLSPNERYIYDEILQKSLEEIELAVCTKSPGTAYGSIMRAILRTRMLCDHGTYLGTTSKSGTASPSTDNEDSLAELQEGDRGSDLSPQSNSSRDGLSRMAIDTLRQIDYDLLLPSSAAISSGYSTKLLALVKNLRSEEPGVKSIVFSCWKTTLDLVEPLLRSNNLAFIRIDGNVSGGVRADLVKKFHNDPKIKIILMTTGTGAVGLNLTIATQVHILEPQWNPSVESQAIGRTLRLTQKKVVTVTRYITENSIEERVQDRQNKKLELVELIINRDPGSEDETLHQLQNLRSLLQV